MMATECKIPTSFPMVVEPTKEDVVERLHQHDASVMLAGLPPFPESRQQAAVLVPLFIRHGQLNVLLTVRSDHLRTHAGQTALPGGKQDETDIDYCDTALRESYEEVGLPRECVDVISYLGPSIGRYGMLVIPVVGFIPEDFVPKPNPTEVQDVFSVPLSMFLKSENHLQNIYTDSGGKSFLMNYFGHAIGKKNYTIFGLTASILIIAATICFDRRPEFELHELGDEGDNLTSVFKSGVSYYMKILEAEKEQMDKSKL